MKIINAANSSYEEGSGGSDLAKHCKDKNHPFKRIEIADGDIDEMDNIDEFSNISESF